MAPDSTMLRRFIFSVVLLTSVLLLSEDQGELSISSSLRIKKIILFARPDDNNQLSQFVELQKHEFPAFLQFKYKTLAEVENAINWMISGSFKPETITKLLFATLFLSGHDKLSEEQQKEIDSLRENTVTSILSQDPHSKFVMRILQNIAFNHDDPRFDQFKIFPTWLLEVYTPGYENSPNTQKEETGFIILEGFTANLLEFLDLNRKTLDGEKLQEYLKIKKGFF